MSSGQRPRTPEHFPRMKWRAARRRQRQRDRIDRAFCLFVTSDLLAAYRRSITAGRIAAVSFPVLPPNRPRLILPTL